LTVSVFMTGLREYKKYKEYQQELEKDKR